MLGLKCLDVGTLYKNSDILVQLFCNQVLDNSMEVIKIWLSNLKILVFELIRTHFNKIF